MKKETIEIKAAYMAPEIRVHEVRAQQSFMSNWGEEDEPGSIMEESEDRTWIF